MKRCAKCGEYKAFDVFTKDIRYKDGYRSYCRACQTACAKESYARNPFPARERAKKYFQEHKAEYAKKKREWSANNKDKIRVYEKTNYERHKDRILAYQAKYQQEHRDRHNEVSRAWAIRNKHNRRYHSMLSKAVLRRALAPWADLDAIKAFYERARELELETGQKWHVDHIVPLRSKIVCGLHCEANLQVLLAGDNIRKGNRWWPDMPCAA